MTRIQAPFTDATRVRPCGPDGAPGPDAFRLTVAGQGHEMPAGEYFLGLRHADPAVDVHRGFQFFGRVWRDREGRWWGTHTGWSGRSDPVALVITGLLGDPHPGDADRHTAAAAPPTAPSVPALPDAVLHAGQRAPARRRAAAAPAPDAFDLFAGAD